MIDFGQLALLSVFPVGALVVGFLALYLAERAAQRDRSAQSSQKPAE